MRYKEVVRSFLESQSNKEYDTNPHSQLHILSQPEVIPNNSGGKENWYIKFITHYMSNLNIPGVRKMLFKRLHKQPDKDIHFKSGWPPASSLQETSGTTVSRSCLILWV